MTQTIKRPPVRRGAKSQNSKTSNARPKIARPKGAQPRNSKPSNAKPLVATEGRYGLITLLVLIMFAFSLLSLLMVFSSAMVQDFNNQGSTWFHFRKQLTWMGIGWALLITTSFIDYRRWARWSTPLLCVSILALVAVLVPGLGVTANGATRWLQLGPITFQPAEIAKFALVIWLARFLSTRIDKIRNPRLSIRPVMLLLGFMALFVLLQPSLGSTLVLAIIAFTMLLIAGSPLGSLLRWSIAGLAGGIALSFSADYRRRRLLSFIDPWDDPLSTDYQAIQSMVSIASGGINGVGLGAGRAKWGYLPYSHTDFIFAVIAEELGFVGAALTICLFVLLGAIGMYLVMNVPNTFAMLLTTGFIAWIVGQFLINIGSTVVLLPITGLPVPFLSFGGSALAFNMAAMGIIINITKQCPRAISRLNHPAGKGMDAAGSDHS